MEICNLLGGGAERMSHWMTSGRNRLKAKENRSFAHRAQSRAVFLGSYQPKKRSREQRRVQEDHPRFYKRTAVQDLGSSWSCPIARRGIVAIGGRQQLLDSNAGETDANGVGPQQQEQQQQSRRIRDLNATRYTKSQRCNSLPGSYRQQQQQHPYLHHQNYQNRLQLSTSVAGQPIQRHQQQPGQRNYPSDPYMYQGQYLQPQSAQHNDDQRPILYDERGQHLFPQAQALSPIHMRAYYRESPRCQPQYQNQLFEQPYQQSVSAIPRGLAKFQTTIRGNQSCGEFEDPEYKEFSQNFENSDVEEDQWQTAESYATFYSDPGMGQSIPPSTDGYFEQRGSAPPFQDTHVQQRANTGSHSLPQEFKGAGDFRHETFNTGVQYPTLGEPSEYCEHSNTLRVELQPRRGILPRQINRTRPKPSRGILQCPESFHGKDDEYYPGFEEFSQSGRAEQTNSIEFHNDTDPDPSGQPQGIGSFRDHQTFSISASEKNSRYPQQPRGIATFQRSQKEPSVPCNEVLTDYSVRLFSPRSPLTSGTTETTDFNDCSEGSSSTIKFYVENVEVDFETGEPINDGDNFDDF